MNTSWNMNVATNVWVVYLVAHDNSDGQKEAEVEPYVGYEPVFPAADDAETRDNCELTAVLRGGYVVAILRENEEANVRAAVLAAEKSLLRMR
jgi:hypothetical protein